MPELPEVETVRRGLEPVMAGARFLSATARRSDLRFPLPANFVRRLKGATVARLGRRGKYLVAPLSTGETLVMHLGMTGRFTINPAAGNGTAGGRQPGAFHQAPNTNPAHDHVEFVLSGASGLVNVTYNDPRRFGSMDLVETARLEESAPFNDMGPEPMDAGFTPAVFFSAVRRRTAPLKSVLLDQRVVAGLGNIYVCEALFAAGLSPRRRASTVSEARAERLHAAIQAILADAIAAGGSTLRDFAASDGALGYFQHRFRVYDRQGGDCPACGAPIRRIVQAGRSTFFCGKCQK